MKKLWILIPLITLSCNTKQETINSQFTTDADLAIPLSADVSNEKLPDSVINNSPGVQEVLREGIMREVNGNQIVRTVDAADFPATLGEEFINNDQELIIKIRNFKNKQLSMAVVPEFKEMNIRINQIKLADGKLDGPMGREIVGYPVHHPGEIWVTIAKSNMASGEASGNFSVKLQ